jgi:predicted RNA-binding Zn-ribbon protein involved in translation (DUF1610 family)/uncharacterized protein YeeX (DUF496 family)
MLTEISAIIATATSATKLLSSLREVVPDPKTREEISKVQGVISELQTKMSDMHAKNAELLKGKDEIEAELKKYKDWDAKAAKYQLRKLASGSFVYASKEAVQPSEPPHYACPKCFEYQKRSILQGVRPEADIHKCPECGFETLSSLPPGQPTVNFTGFRPTRR